MTPNISRVSVPLTFLEMYMTSRETSRAPSEAAPASEIPCSIPSMSGRMAAVPAMIFPVMSPTPPVSAMIFPVMSPAPAVPAMIFPVMSPTPPVPAMIFPAMSPAPALPAGDVILWNILAPASVAMAAPNPAPELTPMICGSASGFLNTACICAPARASRAPDRTAVRVRGIRNSQNTSAGALPPAIMSPAAAMDTSSIHMIMVRVCLILWNAVGFGRSGPGLLYPVGFRI